MKGSHVTSTALLALTQSDWDIRRFNMPLHAAHNYYSILAPRKWYVEYAATGGSLASIINGEETSPFKIAYIWYDLHCRKHIIPLSADIYGYHKCNLGTVTEMNLEIHAIFKNIIRYLISEIQKNNYFIIQLLLYIYIYIYFYRTLDILRCLIRFV